MRFFINIIAVFVFIISSFTFCAKEEGLPKKKLAEMYVDILIAEQTYQFNSDSLNIAVKNVFVKHGVSKNVYDDEVNNLKADEEEWNDFFNLAKSYLDSLKTDGYDPDL